METPSVMVAEQDGTQTEYIFSHPGTVDTSWRTMIPREWQSKDDQMDFTLLPWEIGTEDHILVLPPARWRVMLTRMKEISLSDEQGASLERVIGGSAVKIRPDAHWRIRIPSELAEKVGISRGSKIKFVGRFDKFEIWNLDRLASVSEQDKQVAVRHKARFSI